MKEIIQQLLKQKWLTKNTVDATKRRIAGWLKLPPPSTADLLKEYRQLLTSGKIKPNRKLESLLVKRAVRTLSGVAVVTVLTKPWPCPGCCVYCPKQTGMPKSYLKNEPAAQRAYLTKFDPARQVVTRLQMLYNNGHPTDKIELIVKGGSWQAYSWKYQVWFIEECLRAANGFSLKHKNIKTLKQLSPISYLLSTLIKEQKINEKARSRIVGLTLETRPDLITPKSIEQMRLLGCTRVELGVQHTDEKILKKIRRGHNLQTVRNITRLLKEAGFKVDYHLMPQLPGSSPKTDYEMFQAVFADPNLRPDMIKIYPCTVVKGSELYHWHKQKKYRPYSTQKLIELLIRVKSEIIPRYCRVSRLIRDIPATDIIAGNRVTNLREVIQAEMKKRGLKCRCLRCREAGHINTKTLKPRTTPTQRRGVRGRHLNTKTLKLFIEQYLASGGKEYFLSFEDRRRRIVYAFCRLRLHHPRNPRSNPRYPYFAYIRELHTYGQLISLKHKNIKTLKQKKGAVQHRGLGKKLIATAEEMARKTGADKIAVIAGVGVRKYYQKLGYRLENTYMVKELK